MKPQEIRIGNYFNYRHREIIIINGILNSDNDYFCVYIKGKNGCQIKEYLHPIPLNSDLLQRCGFEVITDDDGDGKDFILEINDFVLQGYYENEDNVLTGVICVDFMTEPLIYLHQLQNLYMDLTNKELNIKL